MSIPIYVADAFTDKPFTGNPAAIVILKEEASDEWMRNVASEMNLSETAFLIKENEKTFHLRWFTPTSEVNLCGHATLASAHILWETKRVALESVITFNTKSGKLCVAYSDDGMTMDFPIIRTHPVDNPPESFVNAVGAPIVSDVMGAGEDLLVEVESESVLKNLKPDLPELKKVNMRGLIVTAVSDDEEFDFASRFFAPAVGIDEDPVTGSAHCALGSYWSTKLQKKNFMAKQVSKRGGFMEVALHRYNVLIKGSAVTTWNGFLSKS